MPPANVQITDDEFVRLFESIGPSALSKHLKSDERSVHRKRKRLEGVIGRTINSPKGPGGLPKSTAEYAPRHHISVPNGQVVVFSDAHFWPDRITTANRALVQYLKLNRSKIKAVINNGDAFDGASISRFPAAQWIDAERRPSVQKELEACEDRLNEIAIASDGAELVWPLGNHDCLDTETECLTKRGWVRYDDIRNDDMILSLDGNVAVWTGINDIVSFYHQGEMLRISQRDTSMLVTLNHRVLLNKLDWRTHQYSIRQLRRADDLPSSFTIPVNGRSEHGGVNLTDDQIRLAGWLLTDGHLDKHNRYNIYQSKVDTTKEIDDMLSRMGIDHSKYSRKRDIKEICGRVLLKDSLETHQWGITAAETRRIMHWLPCRGKLPDWANDLTYDQFSILLDTIVSGNGSWDGNHPENKTCASVYKNKQFLDSLQSVAIQHGWRAKVVQDNRGDYVLRLCKIDNLRIACDSKSIEMYDGIVWCLRVPHENFMVRRYGCAYFTGNSRYEARLAANVPEFSGVSGFHLKDRFTLWHPCWSCWINDDVIVKHTFRAGIHGGYNSTLHSGKTTVTGHTHQLDIRTYADYNGVRYGIQTGTLSEPYGPQFDYTQDNPRSHRSGFVVLSFVDGRLTWPEVVHVVSEGVVEFRGKTYNV